MRIFTALVCAGIAFLCMVPGLMAQMGSWHTVSIIFGGHGTAVSAYDDNHIYALCRYLDEHFIARSDDGGQNWKRVYRDTTKTSANPNNPTQFPLDLGYLISFPDGVVMAAGDSGRIIRSTDYGETWTTEQLPTDQPIGSFSFYKESIGVLHLELYPGVIMLTTDAGATWKVLPLPDYFADKALALVTAVDSTTIFCAASNRDTLVFMRTTDLGVTWTKSLDHPRTISDIVFTDPLHAIAVDWSAKDSIGYPHWNEIYKSNDGGMSWSTVLDTLDQNDPGGLFYVRFQDKMNGLAVGHLSTVYRTTDGGEHWVREHTDLGRALNVLWVSYPPGSDGIILSSDALLAKFERGVGVPLPPQEQAGTLELSPNPVQAGSAFEIALPGSGGKYHVQVSDMLGRTVRELDVVPNASLIRVSVTGFNRGHYFVHVTSGARAWESKLEVR